MKSIRRALKYTNINNISRDNMRGCSRTRKWRAHGSGADAKHFSRQYVRLNSHDSVAAIIHVAAFPSFPRVVAFPTVFPPLFFGNVFKARGVANRKRLCLARVATAFRRSRARFIIVTLCEVLPSARVGLHILSLVPSPLAAMSLIPWN